MFLSSFRRSHVKRCVGLIAAAAFFWSFVLATPAQLMAQSALHPAKRLGVRVLSEAEMERMVGRQSHYLSYSPASGSTYPWEASVGRTNTGNGNKLTSVPIVGWTARGGMPVDLTLVLHRHPRGEWVGMNARTLIEPDGVGMSFTRLFDQEGYFGRSLHTLYVTPR